VLKYYSYPTAIGWAVSQDAATNEEQYNAWQTIQRSHAVANGVYVVSVNRVGNEGPMKFWEDHLSPTLSERLCTRHPTTRKLLTLKNWIWKRVIGTEPTGRFSGTVASTHMSRY